MAEKLIKIYLGRSKNRFLWIEKSETSTPQHTLIGMICIIRVRFASQTPAFAHFLQYSSVSVQHTDIEKMPYAPAKEYMQFEIQRLNAYVKNGLVVFCNPCRMHAAHHHLTQLANYIRSHVDWLREHFLIRAPSNLSDITMVIINIRLFGVLRNRVFYVLWRNFTGLHSNVLSFDFAPFRKIAKNRSIFVIFYCKTFHVTRFA